MGALSTDLKEMGYEPTDKESPFDEDGSLWTKGFELVCDETGAVIRPGDRSFQSEQEDNTVYRYRNSEKVKLIGGFLGNYHWGEDGDGRFRY